MKTHSFVLNMQGPELYQNKKDRSKARQQKNKKDRSKARQQKNKKRKK